MKNCLEILSPILKVSSILWYWKPA